MAQTKPLHHIVLFKLAEPDNDQAIRAMIEDAKALLGGVPGVLTVDLGLKARDNRDVHIRDYDLALYVQLETNAALDIYSPHPNHQEFLQRHKAKWTKVQVVDFFGQ